MLILLVSSCAPHPQFLSPVFEFQQASKIGIINFVKPTMTHYHIGTTVFNNFTKEIDVNWNIPSFINDEIKQQATELGYHAVIIEPENNIKSILDNATLVKNDKVVLNPEVITHIQKFTKEFDIRLFQAHFKPILPGRFETQIQKSY